jgi:catechol 2,3-dioxygenase-like lactoylglutathione lyase family enzyme
MIRLARLGHVALFVADLERARDFYVRLLGYHVLEEESAEHGRTAFLEIGELGNTLDLVEAPAGAGAAAPGAPPGRGLHHLAFETATREALRDAYSTLVDQGVEILYRVDHGSSQSIYFRDPDGHIIEIYWTPPGARELWKQGRGDEHRELKFER